MNSIGSDPDALDRLARALTDASSELDRAARRIDVALARSGWDGPDGARFRRSWTGVDRRRLIDAAASCGSMSRHVARQSGDQRRASAGTGAPSAVSRLAPLRDATVHQGTITASIGPLSAALSGRLTIEEVGNRRHVTYADEVQVGAAAAAGRGVTGHLGTATASTGAVSGAGAALENTVRRTWDVGADEVTALLVALVVEQGLTHGPVGLLDRSASQGLRALDALGDAVGVELPDPLRRLGEGSAVGSGALAAPVRSEDLIGVELSADAWVALGAVAPGVAPSAAGHGSTGARAESTVRVGTVVDGRDHSLLLEVEGDIGARLGEGMGVSTSGRSATTRIEVPVGHGARPLLITVVSGDEERVVTRVSVEPTSGAATSSAAREAVERVMQGDPVGGLRRLAGLELHEGTYQLEQAVQRSKVDDGGFSFSTPAASLSVEGRTERRAVAP